MNNRMPRGPRGCKARRDTSVRAPNVPSAAAVPLRALLPGAFARVTVRGPGAVEWLAFLAGRPSR